MIRKIYNQKNGGLLVGQDRYNIQLIGYDDKSSQSAEVAAINRLVYEDKVKTVVIACVESKIGHIISESASHKFAGVIGNGLEWSDPKGECKMISRPELGNDRTVDSIRAYYLKRVHNGISAITTRSTPPGGPPPGVTASPVRYQ